LGRWADFHFLPGIFQENFSAVRSRYRPTLIEGAERMRAPGGVFMPDYGHMEGAQSAVGARDQTNAFTMDEYLFTAEQVAERLGVSERWVRDHATRRNPRIRAVKLGPLLRFRWSDVQELVAELATKKPFKGR
jgi:excisionase family DNA binding protein